MKIKITFVCLAVMLTWTGLRADEMEPSEILKKTIEAYQALETYRSEGTIVVEAHRGGAPDGKIVKTGMKFSIKPEKPDLYLISWDQKMPVQRSGAVWNDGSGPYFYTSELKSYSKLANDELALDAGRVAFRRGAGSTIFSLVLKVNKGPNAPFWLSQLKREDDEKVDDDDCYVVSGSSPRSKKETFWISKESLLIRKFSRDLALPDWNHLNYPELTDERLEKIIKASGQEVTKDRIEEARRQQIKELQVTGTMTETQSKIDSPALEAKDLRFEVPEGTELKDLPFVGSDTVRQLHHRNYLP